MQINKKTRTSRRDDTFVIKIEFWVLWTRNLSSFSFFCRVFCNLFFSSTSHFSSYNMLSPLIQCEIVGEQFSSFHSLRIFAVDVVIEISRNITKKHFRELSSGFNLRFSSFSQLFFQHFYIEFESKSIKFIPTFFILFIADIIKESPSF